MRQSGRHAGRWRRSRPCWSTRGLKELHPEAQVRLKVHAAAPFHPSPPHLGTSAPCHHISAIVCACDTLATLSQAWLFELHFFFPCRGRAQPVRHLSGRYLFCVSVVCYNRLGVRSAGVRFTTACEVVQYVNNSNR